MVKNTLFFLRCATIQEIQETRHYLLQNVRILCYVLQINMVRMHHLFIVWLVLRFSYNEESETPLL